jgi:uncharacterized membrane protein
VARLFSIKPSLTMRGRKFKGLRGLSGKPLHPPLTDIPIGAYILGGTFDLISFALGERTVSAELHKAATFLFIAGAIVSAPTALTGFWDWLKSTPKHTQAWRTANWHMAVMVTTTVLVLIDIWLRLGTNYDYTETGLMILSLVIAGSVSFGALYGGALVYEMGFNVETAGDSPVWHESETDVYPGQE